MARDIRWSFFHKFSCRSSRPLFLLVRTSCNIHCYEGHYFFIDHLLFPSRTTNQPCVALYTGSLIFFRTYLALVISVPSLYHEYVGGGSAIASQKIVLFSCIRMSILLAGGPVFHFGITEEVKQASKSTGKTDM